QAWAHQQKHVQQLVGRADELATLREWCDRATDGDYFLLTGSPMIGKSTLLATFAAANGATGTEASGPCIYHAIKVDPSPPSFLKFLLWQANRYLGGEVEATEYRGDVAELENRLVKRLEMMVEHAGRVLVVLDGLDELRPDDRDLLFLP